MIARRRKSIDGAVANFLKSEIESGSALKRKHALQWLCSICSRGATLQQADRIGIENAVLGVLGAANSDTKIVRWALVALTHIGRPNVSEKAVFRALNEFPDEPQVLSAAIATIFKFRGCEARSLVLNQDNCTPELVMLSALQTTNFNDLAISNVRVDIQTAEPIILKLALLLVGLNRSPEHIFEPRHSNAEIVKILGVHDETIVSQYSIWAALENPQLGVKDIGIDLKDLESYQPNVRSYIYRIFAGENEPSTERHEVLALGSKDTDLEARLGLAIGIKDTYYDGLETITVDWFYDEEDPDIRQSVLDHVVTQSGKIPSYEDIAIEQYKLAENNPNQRKRMEAAAAGTNTFPILKRIGLEKEAGMFGLLGGTVTNNFVNNGTMQGAISQSGTALNDGDFQASFTPEQRESVIQILEGVAVGINDISMSDKDKKEIVETVAEAKKSPSKDTIVKVLNGLERAEKSLKALNGITEQAKKLSPWISALGPFSV